MPKGLFLGAWPPTPDCHPQDAGEFRDVIGKVEKGEHRATFAKALEDYTFKFFRDMKPEEFERMARAALQVVGDGKNKPIVRTRAAKLLMNPMNRAMKIMLRLEDANDRPGIQHLQECFRAYVAELSLHRDKLKQAGEMLFNMVSSPDAYTAVTGIEAIMELILSTLDTLATVREHDTRTLRLRTPVDQKNPKVIAAYNEMNELEAELQAKIQAEESDRESA